MIKKQGILLGAHMSVSGGFYRAIERGASIGCTTLQIFTKSNRQWGAKSITPEEIALFEEAQNHYSLYSLVAHASYLINIGSVSPEIEQRSCHALRDELERCSQLSIPYLVVHPGSATGSDIQDCLEHIARNLDAILQTANSKVTVLLELMAGQGSAVCYTFEQLATIRSAMHHKNRVGICFDTCHAFAAGYDFRTQATYEALWNHFDKTLGLEQLKVIHLNDSKKELGSRVDRHEHIGKGKIGIEAFRLIMQDARFGHLPKILETPKDSLEDDKRNLELLYSLL